MDERLKELEEKLRLRKEFMDKALDILRHPKECECNLCLNLKEIPSKIMEKK